MKIGIVGLGSIGKRHAINATKLGHDVHVYDPAVKGDFRFRYERDLYDWCDAAVIATPSQFHESGLRACVERGKHALVEKPISVAIGTLPELFRIAANKKLVVMIGNNLRFNPVVIRAKQWLGDGKIGHPIWANFICAAQTDKPGYLTDGVVLNTGAHEVDMAMHLFGPATLKCATARWSNNSDEIANFTLLHESGVYSSFHLDHLTPDRIREFWVGCSVGNFYADLDYRAIRRYDELDNPDWQVWENSYDTDYMDEMRAFIDRIEGKDVPGATGADGLATLQVLLDVRKMAGLA